MRQVLNDIAAAQLADDLRRGGIAPSQRLRVVIESIETDEPDLYSDDDLVERFRSCPTLRSVRSF